MKRNTNITAAVLTLLTVLAFAALSLAGCENLTDPLGKTPLATPANVRVDDAGKTAFTLKWDAVEGADSYTLDINGELKSVSDLTTSYDLRALTEDPKVYPVRVRAVASNGDTTHSDSAYSAPLNVEPAEYIFTYQDDLAASPGIQPGRGIARAAGDGTITGLTNYGKGLERIVIPPRIGSITITTIGNDAFKDNAVMTAISLPETLITIGAGALSGTNISSIIIPESVLTIGNGAFSNIIVLVVVVFVSPEPPALGNGVFTGSEAIETIVVPDGKGTAYQTMIEEAAPDLAETIEEAKEEKLLIGIEVVQPPKTDYTAGEQFSSAGMTVFARYSDNTTSSITNYAVMLQTSAGGFSAQSRALTVNDTAVRLSYTEGSITRITTVTIKVTGQQPTGYAITVNQTTGGTITTNPSGNAAAGTSVTVTGAPDDNYYLASIRVMAGNTPVDSQESPDGGYTFTMPAAAVTVTGTFAEGGTGEPGTDYTITVNQTTGGTITTNPSGNAPANTDVTVTVSPNQGYTFNSSSLSVAADNYPVEYQAVSGSNNSYTFTMPASDVMISGTFTTSGTQPTGYAITVNQTEGGTITTNPSGSAAANTTVTVTGAPDDNYYLASIRVMAGNTLVDSQESPDGSGYTFTMPASDVTVTGTFAESGTVVQTYIIMTYTSIGGTITTDPSGSAVAGALVTVNATTDQDYAMASLLSVTSGDQPIEAQAKDTAGTIWTFTMPASDVVINGAFATRGGEPEYRITPYVNGDGSVTTDPQATAGTTVWFYVTPYQGSTMESLSVRKANGDDIDYQAGTNSATGGSGYTFTMPSMNVVINAEFTGGTTPSEYKIYVSETTGGTITTNPEGNAPAKSTVTVTVSPNQGYTFDSSSLSVVADNYPVDYQTSQSSTGVVYTFTMPDSDIIISGTFTGGSGQTGYTITTYAVGGTGNVPVGTITTNPSGSVAAGTSVKITGTPNDNYYLASIRVTAGNTLVDSQESPAGDGYIFTMPAAAVTVTGTFALKE